MVVMSQAETLRDAPLPDYGQLIAEDDAAKPKRSRHQRRARNRAENPVPFWQRELVTPTEVVNHLSIGRRKLDELLAEQRVESILIDERRYVVVPSLKRLIDAGRNVRLPEPPQMAHAKTAKAQAV